MKVTCPECKRNFPVPDDSIGHKLRCSECGALFVIPDETPASPPAMQPPSDPFPDAKLGYALQFEPPVLRDSFRQ